MVEKVVTTAYQCCSMTKANDRGKTDGEHFTLRVHTNARHAATEGYVPADLLSIEQRSTNFRLERSAGGQSSLKVLFA